MFHQINVILSFALVGDDDKEILLTVSQDGFVIKYVFTNTPVLIGNQQIRLDRIKRSIEDTSPCDLEPKIIALQADRYLQTVNIYPNILLTKLNTFFSVAIHKHCYYK